MTSRKLGLGDIADLRAYNNEREAFLRHVIALKKKRRVAVGPFVTLLFENRDTIRFQIQEMARVERLDSDAAIEAELAIYNPLIPEPGHLSATLFVELTTEADLRAWLPKLVGVERAVSLRVGDEVVRATPDAAHADQLTREDVTASVHYVGFALTPAQVRRFGEEPVTLAITHPNYTFETVLGSETKDSLARDLSDKSDS